MPKWIGVTLIILSPAILYIIALIAVAIKHKYFPPTCPRCGERGLRYVHSALVRGHREDHKVVCWQITYYECPRCKARLKYEREEWTDADPRDWSSAIGEVHQPPSVPTHKPDRGQP